MKKIDIGKFSNSLMVKISTTINLSRLGENTIRIKIIMYSFLKRTNFSMYLMEYIKGGRVNRKQRIDDRNKS